MCTPYESLTNRTLLFSDWLSGKKRKPAWTDRILWRVKPKGEDDDNSPGSLDDDDEYPLKVVQDVYTCNMEYGVSDHKPVTAIFTLEVKSKCVGGAQY